MDLLTGGAYVVILVLVVLNAFLVRKMNIIIRDEDEE